MVGHQQQRVAGEHTGKRGSIDPAEPRFYWEFVEQMNEQRELLVALTFLLYALYRVARLRADLYRFDFALAEEGGDWRVTSASWRRAEAGDFLPEL